MESFNSKLELKNCFQLSLDCLKLHENQYAVILLRARALKSFIVFLSFRVPRKRTRTHFSPSSELNDSTLAKQLQTKR